MVYVMRMVCVHSPECGTCLDIHVWCMVCVLSVDTRILWYRYGTCMVCVCLYYVTDLKVDISRRWITHELAACAYTKKNNDARGVTNNNTGAKN